MDVITLLLLILLAISLMGFCVLVGAYVKAGEDFNQIEILQTHIQRLDSIRKALTKSYLMDLYRRKLD
jgi:hypothetical protein